jgi:hypothetical protein
MPAQGQNIIELGFNVEQLDAQKKQVLDILLQVTTRLKEIDGTQLKPISLPGFSDLKTQTDAQKKAVDDLSLSVKEYSSIQNQRAQTEAKVAAAGSDAAKQLAEQKVQLQQVNKENKDAALAALGLTGAYKELSNQFRQASQEAKNLAAQAIIDPKFSEQAKQAAAVANELNNKLKTIDASVGDFRRNVGNYTGAITILEKSFNDIKEKMDQLNAAGQTNSAEFQNLSKQYGLLEVVVNANAKGFTSLQQELRTNERALQTLSEQGLQNTEVFKNLQTTVVNAKREFNDFARSQKLLESEAPLLTGLTVAAKGLAGAYAIGAGAAALFADGDEKLQKELNKLVAIMTLLQGLEEAYKLSKEAGAIAQVIQTNVTKIGIVAQNLWKATLLSSTAATLAFRIALIGLTGGLLLLLPLLASGAKSGDEVSEGFKKIDNASDETKKALSEMGKTISEIADNAISSLTDEVKSLDKELGYELPSNIDKATAALQLLNKQATDLQKQDGFFHSFTSIGDSFKRIGAAFGLGETLDEQLTKNADQRSKLRQLIAKDEADKKTKIVSDELKDETNLYQVETKQQAELAIDANKRVLSNDKSTFADKITALKSNLSEQSVIIQQELNKSLQEAGTNESERKIATDKANADSIKSRRDYFEQLNKLTDDYSKLSSAAQKKILQNDVATYKTISENENNGYGLRLAALKEFYDKQDKLNELNYKSSIANAKTKDEVVLAEQERDIARLDLLKTFNITYQSLLKQEFKEEENLFDEDKKKKDELNKEIEAASSDRINDELDIYKNGAASKAKIIQTGALEEQTALTEKYNQGLISEQKYQEGIKKIQEKASKDALGVAIQTAEIQLNLLAKSGKAGTKEWDDLKLAIAGAKKELASLGASDTANSLSKVQDKIEKISEITNNLTSAVTSLNDIGYENQKAKLEEIEAQQEKNYEQEVTNINNSTLSEQDKANKLKILEAERAIQKEANDRKQKEADNKKAKFDRDLSVLNIITGTAAAVVKALPNIPLAIAVGIAGAAELAKALTVKIPQYAEGTDAHPGGLAVVGEGKHSELVQMPGGISFIADKPMLLDLPLNTKVLPLTDDINEMANRAMIINTARMLEFKEKNDNNVSKMLTQTNKILSVIAKKETRNVTHVNTRVDLGWTDYLKKNVYGKG